MCSSSPPPPPLSVSFLSSNPSSGSIATCTCIGVCIYRFWSPVPFTLFRSCVLMLNFLKRLFSLSPSVCLYLCQSACVSLFLSTFLFIPDTVSSPSSTCSIFSFMWRYGLVVSTRLCDQKLRGSSLGFTRLTLSPWKRLFACIFTLHSWVERVPDYRQWKILSVCLSQANQSAATL